MTEYTTHYFKPSSAYSVSIGYDRRLYSYDIAGSMAHVRMLVKQEIILASEGDALLRGLETIKKEIETDSDCCLQTAIRS